MKDEKLVARVQMVFEQLYEQLDLCGRLVDLLYDLVDLRLLVVVVSLDRKATASLPSRAVMRFASEFVRSHPDRNCPGWARCSSECL